MSTFNPFFSICVATRNRSETLLYCLKTLLHQNFESYEIIVSDNCDPEESALTKKIIEELASPKIRYFKPDSILSMTGNFEFALSKVTGDFIMCMGDDDGLVVDSLQYVHAFIEKYGAKVVKSPVPLYYWKNSIDFPDSVMFLPFPRPVTTVDSRSMLEKVASFEMGYYSLPMIYYAFVAKEIVEGVIAEQGNFFQNTASIDMYSGFVIAYKTQQYYISDKPFLISGVSSKSTGASAGTNAGDTVSKEFNSQHNLVEIYDKYQVPMLPKYDLPTFIMLEIKKFIANYNIPESELKINPRKVLLNFLSVQPIVDNAEKLKYSDEFNKYPVYQNDIDFIKRKFFGKQLYFPFLGNNDVQLMNGGEIIDPDIFGVKDVYDASVIFKKLIDKENLEPLYITIKRQDVQKPILVKRALNRIKRSINVLLGH